MLHRAAAAYHGVRPLQSPTQQLLLLRYLGAVRGLVRSFSVRLTPDELSEVTHLVEHGEPAEGLRSLAWILVERNDSIPAGAFAEIAQLVEGLVPPEDLPAEVSSHMQPKV